jgi:hypothetical protein
MPIELDTLTKGKTGRKGKKVGLKNRKKKGSYYTYSKPGHYARNYRSRRIP